MSMFENCITTILNREDTGHWQCFNGAYKIHKECSMFQVLETQHGMYLYLIQP